MEENKDLLPEEEGPYIINFIDEDGEEVSFEYLDCVEYEGKEYLCLTPNEEGSDEVVILEIVPVDEENEDYLTVEDDAILDAVFGIFMDRYKDFTEA